MIFRPLVTLLKVLSGFFNRNDILSFTRADLVFGLYCTWLVGIGRHWDNIRAEPLQLLGVGSVIYVFILAFIIWIFIKPMKVEHWRYFNVLTFVTLTAPPAALYAIPVENYTDMSTAQSINVWFLAAVAGWRVLLLILFISRYAQLGGCFTLIVALLPLALIVSALSMLNLEHVIFRMMAGIRESERSAGDDVHVILFLLTGLSFYLSPFLLVAYFAIVSARRKAKSADDAAIDPDIT